MERPIIDNDRFENDVNYRAEKIESVNEFKKYTLDKREKILKEKEEIENQLKNHELHIQAIDMELELNKFYDHVISEKTL